MLDAKKKLNNKENKNKKTKPHSRNGKENTLTSSIKRIQGKFQMWSRSKEHNQQM